MRNLRNLLTATALTVAVFVQAQQVVPVGRGSYASYTPLANCRSTRHAVEWGNYKGIICPLFSAIWAAVGAVYYLGFHSWLPDIVDYLIAQNYMLFVFGVFYDILAVDFAYAMQVSAKIRKFAEENGIVVFYAEFKENIAASREQKNQKAEFAFVFRGNMQEYLRDYADKLRSSAENMKEKVKENTEQVKAQIQENTDHIKVKMQENTEEFKEKARENTEHIKGKVQENKDNIKEKIKKKKKK